MEKQLNIPQRSERLRQEMTLANLYALTFDRGDSTSALWLEGTEERTRSFQETDKRVRSMAALLSVRLKDVEKGAFVAIAMDTCPDWQPIFWAVEMSGYNALLLDFSLKDEMCAHMLKEAGARAIITVKPRTLPGVQQLTREELAAAPEAEFAPAFGTMVALCTSGTTATSRIFVYDEKAVCEQVLNSELLYKANKRIIADEARRSLAFLPFHHVFGFMVCVLWVSFIGYANVYLKDRAPSTVVDTCSRCGVQLIVTVPLLANSLSVSLQRKVAKESAAKRAAFRAMMETSLGLQRMSPDYGLRVARDKLFPEILDQMLGRKVECIILGGSHTPAEHLRVMNAIGYYTVCGFGMTETAVTSVEHGMDLQARLSGSVGRPLESAEYRILPDGSDPDRGEMAIRGATLHTYRLVAGRLLPPDRDAEGWYRTGDVVRLGEGGRMYVEGRIKDVIVGESGENVYPDELEDTFAGLPNVEQLSVLGLPKAGVPYEAIALVMNVGPSFQSEQELSDLQALVAERNAKLPVLKKLERVIVTPEALPVVNGIKVKRVALREMIVKETLPMMELSARKTREKSEPIPAAAPSSAPADELTPIREQVRLFFAEVLDRDPASIKDDDHFIEDLGGDSLQVLSIALKAEEKYGITIPAESYGDCATVASTARVIRRIQLGEVDKPETAPVTPIRRFEDSPEFKAFQARQESLIKGMGSNPYFVCHDSPLTDTSMMAGHKVLNFGSYNYVGMSGRKEVEEAAKAAIDKYGTSASGSRLLAGEKSLYQELEQTLARWKHAEDCLVLVGGHSTNVTMVGNFCGAGDLIVYDALAHNSIEQGCRLSRATARPFPHNDAAALESILKNTREKYGKVLIVIEGAYSMDGDIADVPAFVALKKKYGCFLMVDEAHSACVIGQTGGGVDEYFGLEMNDVDIKMGTLSKGLGTCGGYLAGSTAIIEYLRYNLPGFVFSVGISPPLAAATLKSVQLLQQDPSIMERMRRNIQVFLDGAHKRNLNTCLAKETAIVPILVGSDEDAFHLSNVLREKGVFVPPAVYPAVPKGKARLRFCVISEHKPEQIEQALDILVKTAAEEHIALPAMNG